MRWRAVRATAVGAIGVTVVALAGPSAHAAPAPETPGAATVSAVHAVTLVTGDKVVVEDRADGTHQVAVEPGAGRAGIRFLQRSGKDRAGHDQLRVVPVDALVLLQSGRLDARLFDVTGLIRQGYDDAARPELPLIVSYQAGTAAPRAVAGTAVRRALPSVNGVALREPRSQAGTFWASVAGSAAGALAPRALAGGVARIWLDGRAKLLDDASNAQIGVPTAWQAGFTGKGVTVAVLDGGYDTTHPDLAGVVADSKDFTGSADGVTDTFGHGTHVASIIAGSGAASAGKYKGVAPDARLIVGRVCGDQFCEDSAVLAGMEWAAAQHAKVVNLSLGSFGGDGTDPESVAVNNLTASAGTLFVIAAGNDGPIPGAVSSPAAADAALAVASVGRTDAISDFSSRGPRTGDFAVKPDIAAPGEDIVAARAAGTSLGNPVDEHYTALSGTSMATPHVTGTAAILAQQHPDWSPATLKAALMSTAKPVADAGVYDQGAGRVDIARAVTQPVYAEQGSISFGFLSFPVTGHQPATSTVKYHNDGDAAVVLSLATSATDPAGVATPAGAFTLDAASVTIPAHGTATAAVTEHPDVLATGKVGSFSGRLTATGPGGVTVQTALGVTTEAESYDVTMTVVDRNGKPAGDTMPAVVFLTLLDVTGGRTAPDIAGVSGGMAKVRLPKGAYGVTNFVISETPGKPGFPDATGTLAAVPTLVVDHPGITLTFDARQGRKVEAIVDAKDAKRFTGTMTVQYTVKTDDGDLASAASLGGGPGNDLFAVPVRGDAKTFAFGFDTIATATGHGPDRTYYLAFPFVGRIPGDLRLRVRDANLHTADARYHAQGVDTAVADRVEFAHFLPGQTFSSADVVQVTMPGRRIELHSAAPVVWSGAIFQQYLPGGTRNFFEGAVEVPDTAYRAGRTVRQEWNDAVFGPDLSIQADTNFVQRSGNTLTAAVSSYSPGDAGHVGSPFFDIFSIRGTAVLSRDGAVIATKSNPNIGSYPLPGDTGRYTLALTANRSVPWSALATQVGTAWTFTSGPSTKDGELLSLPTVKVSGDFDGSVRAKGGARFTLDVRTATQGGAPRSKVTSTSVQFSDDDGKTWQPVQCSENEDGVWRVSLTNPLAGHGTGFVSLRVKAANALGNTIEQTVIRAYGLT
ncbi:MAG: hypothetical protein AUI14_26785 [Actinobacteria bacterium 13_2_20CM_2_71_6]|nr:MAG: hypothetical protein AUI14_26785 [Actinobacteria bacterium 13_2_20CM_2_71_6]